ncbi:hypothetical protein D6833_10665 [Candidatus Parcubacteria bacterium]|nr:MAG: hypothetical protein D6833_10665 [Candidatus Parcubacteria bacterium]
MQNLRKEAGFDIADKIILFYQSGGRIVRVVNQWADYIKAETLALEIRHALIPERAFMKMEKVDGETVTLGVEKVEGNADEPLP